jgi:hypothetical protein
MDARPTTEEITTWPSPCAEPSSARPPWPLAHYSGASSITSPYKQVKRALKAEIDESVWASLYAAVSRPFEKPETGKIAIKVINHYGDEVLKVYSA